MSIPITIGVAGHRDLRVEDLPELYKVVEQELKKIIDAYPASQIIMINSLAEGSGQLCAEAALKIGISLIVPLPKEENEYRKDFTGEVLAKFIYPCNAASEVFTVPYSELKQDQARDHYYRQAGIYVANHSHVLLVLWDGQEPSPNGCGTAETVDS